MTEAASKQSNERLTPDDVIASQRNRQLMVVTVIILVLAGLIAVTRLASGEVERLREVPVLGEDHGFEPADVHHVVMSAGEDEVIELERDGDGWVLPGAYNHPADKSSVDSLVQRVFDASRFNRPVTTDPGSYVRYRLDDDEGARLSLMDADNKPVIRLMVGSSETGTRDFIRYLGDDAPEGVFELGGVGGHFQTIYSALLLSDEGGLRPKNWLDLSRFRPLPAGADVEEIRVRDGDTTLHFRRSEDDDSAWQMLAPGVGPADEVRVDGIVDALQNLRASDVAGTKDSNPAGTAGAEREVAVTYNQGDDETTARVYFGNADEDRVAVRLEGDTGFVYWSGNSGLQNIFRPMSDFLKRERLGFLPPGLEIESIEITDGDRTIRLDREGDGADRVWTMTEPFDREAVFSEVQALLREIDGLRGYRDATMGRDAPELVDAPRRIVIRVPGDDGEVRTDSLSFGKAGEEDIAVLLSAGDREQVFLVSEESLSGLFRPAQEYVKATDLEFLPADANLDSIRIHDGDNVTTLEQRTAEDESPVWTMTEPQQSDADFDQAMGLVRRLNGLEGLVAEGELDRTELQLGEGLSERLIVINWTADDEEASATLYFGKQVGDDVAVLLSRGDREEVYWLPWYELYRLFQPHVDLLPLPARYEARVVHVLVSWKGKNQRVTPRDSNRTEREAWKLAEKVREEARAGTDFEELQEQFSEKGAGSDVFDVSESAELEMVEPFKRLSIRLQPGEVDFIESQFGIHIIKRIE